MGGDQLHVLKQVFVMLPPSENFGKNLLGKYNKSGGFGILACAFEEEGPRTPKWVEISLMSKFDGARAFWSFKNSKKISKSFSIFKIFQKIEQNITTSIYFARNVK